MTREDAITLVSRTVSIYLAVWALDALSYLPERLFSFSHYAVMTGFASPAYLKNYYFVTLAMLFVRVVALFALAGWFYNAGPKLEGFFFFRESTDPQ
jgi:hypothetical protein